MLRRYDYDNSGGIEIDEFRKLYYEIKAYQDDTGNRPDDYGTYDDVDRAFKKYDDDGSGDIDVQELRRALNDLGLRADESQTRDVMRRYDDNGDGTLQLGEFRRLVEELRRFGVGGGQYDDIERIFRKYDDDNSNSIDVQELRRALNDLGLHADESQTRDVMRKYDTNGDGDLQLSEFRLLVEELRRFGVGGGGGGGGGAYDDIEAEFRRADTDGSGDIDFAELKPALRSLGMEADSETTSKLLYKYSTGSALRLDEFRLLVEELRAFQRSRGGGGSYYGGGGGGSSYDESAFDVERIFRRYDADNSGDIDVDELRQALPSLGISVDGQQARQVMQRFAAAGQTTLSLPEFRRLVEELKSFQRSPGRSPGRNW